MSRGAGEEALAKGTGSGAQHPCLPTGSGKRGCTRRTPGPSCPLGLPAVLPRPGPRGCPNEPLCLACSSTPWSCTPARGRRGSKMTSVTAPSPAWDVRTAGGTAAPAPSLQATWRKQHLEQIPQTETCPGSKITTGNPNGLSLATHQTAFVEKHTDGCGHGKAPNSARTSTDLRIPRKRWLLWKRSCFRRREGVCRLLSNSRIKKTNKRNPKIHPETQLEIEDFFLTSTDVGMKDFRGRPCFP